MKLKDLKSHIEAAPNGFVFPYGLSEPFSWRGSYDEVAFDIVDQPTAKETILNSINAAYTGTFFGYKGGEYTYGDYSYVHFEQSSRDYTDGRYAGEWIAKIEQKPQYSSQQERLVNLAFPLR